MKTIDRDVSRDRMPKKKIKKGKNNKSNSPKGQDEKEMPYSGNGTINLELGENSAISKRNIS